MKTRNFVVKALTKMRQGSGFHEKTEKAKRRKEKELLKKVLDYEKV